MPSATLATAAEYAALAAKQVGKPYVLGQPSPYNAPNPKSFDCSGIVIWLNNKTYAFVMGDDTAAGLYNRSSAVKAGTERVGDLVFLRNNPARSNRIGHVAVLTSKLSNGDWLIIEAKGRAYGVVRTTLSFWRTRKHYTGVRRLRGFKLAATSTAAKVPIVIVAGSANTTTGALHTKYRRRLDIALPLLQKDPKLKIIVTGGVKAGRGSTSEASQAKAYLLSKGIAASRILLEDTSGSTHSNFTRGLPIAKAAGATSLIVVSDFSHMRRCLAFAYAANQAKKTSLPVSAVAWYTDGTGQDATVAQATQQARAAWSGMTEAIVRDLDTTWGITAPKPKPPAIPATVRKGSKGATVGKLQKALNNKGASPKLTVDNNFGGKTDTAVRAFQRKHKLTADGIVGPKTWAKLLA